MDSVLGNKSFHEFVASVTYCGSLLTDIKLVSKEHVQPTVHFLQEVLCALQEDTEPEGQYCNKGSHDQDVCHALFSCLVSVLRYWLFHEQPPNPVISRIVLEVCKVTFRNPYPKILCFEDFTHINMNLGNISLCNLLRQGKVLLEYLIHSEAQPQDVFELGTRLLGASSVALPGMLKSACKVSVYICLVLYLHTCSMCVCVCLCMHVCMRTCKCVCVCVCVFVYACVHAYMCACKCVRVRVCVCVCLCVCVCVCVCVFVCVCDCSCKMLMLQTQCT